jgi:hypothetical protein
MVKIPNAVYSACGGPAAKIVDKLNRNAGALCKCEKDEGAILD